MKTRNPIRTSRKLFLNKLHHSYDADAFHQIDFMNAIHKTWQDNVEPYLTSLESEGIRHEIAGIGPTSRWKICNDQRKVIEKIIDRTLLFYLLYSIAWTKYQIAELYEKDCANVLHRCLVFIDSSLSISEDMLRYPVEKFLSDYAKKTGDKNISNYLKKARVKRKALIKRCTKVA